MGRLAERRRIRDEKEKRFLRLRIAQAVAPVLPAGEQTAMEAMGYALLPPLHPLARSMRMRDRFEALWHRMRAYESYIVPTEEHLIVVPGVLGWPGTVKMRTEDVDKWRSRRDEGAAMETPFPTTRRYCRFWMTTVDGVDLWLIVVRPWVSDAQELRRALPLG